jgi:S1-C subfamily serine protease
MLRSLLLLALASAAGPPFLAPQRAPPLLGGRAGAAVAFHGASGFVVSEDGLVITANHVAEMVGERPLVHLAWQGGAAPLPLRLDLVATDPLADLALYRLPPGHYDHISLRAAPAEAGEPVWAMAHPPEEALRFSHGRVLAAPATWAGQPILEYDAPAYDGYSGGAVLDERGRAVGVHRGWDHRGLSHGALVAVPATAVLESFPQLQAAQGPPRAEEDPG